MSTQVGSPAYMAPQILNQ